MKIFYYAQVDLSGETGSPGSVRHVLKIVNGLSNRGHHVTLFVPEPSGRKPEVLADRTITFPTGEGVLGFLRGIFVCCWLMIVELIRHRPDYLYGREMLYTAHTTVLARLFGVPHVTEVNGFQPEDVPMDPQFRHYRYPFLVFAEGLNYWLSSGLVTVSKALKTRVSEAYRIDPARVKTINNGVDTDVFEPPETQVRKETPHIVGFLGHLFPWSGVETLIRCVPDVLASRSDVRFEIVGDGQSLRKLEELVDRLGVSGAVEFVGRLSRDSVPDRLRQWTLGISPYTSERQTLDSLKTYEYLASGLPVVVSDRPELARLIRDGDCGLVFEANNPTQLANRILHLLNSPERRSTMGENGRRTIEEDYSWERAVDQTETWLGSV